MKSHYSLRLYRAGILGAIGAVPVTASFQIAWPIAARAPRIAFEKLNRTSLGLTKIEVRYARKSCFR